MTPKQISALVGERLDVAVWNVILPSLTHVYNFSPSTDWAQAGPIIDEYKIATIYWGDDGDDGNPWGAQVRVGGGHYIDTTPSDEFSGPTALIAAMRALVAHFAEVDAR